jgi:hypothetical protein
LRRLTAIPGARSLWCRFPVGSVQTRTDFGIWERPHYAYGIHCAALQARGLGLPAISAIEFGVAGGRGLVAMQSIAGQIAADTGVAIRVFGFDSGQGMPPPTDYRDLPYVWQGGWYKMEPEKVRARLQGTELILGDVAETVSAWVRRADVPPVGFAAFDLDYYSSTKQAFGIFAAQRHLPRTYCYFDDIMWPEHACHNEFIGELCAIREFNEEHAHRKICPIHLLGHMRPHPAAWNDHMYVMHDFQHELYCRNLTPAGAKHRELPL